MSDIYEKLDRWSQVTESDAYRIALRLDTLRFAFIIFERNYIELKSYLDHVQTPEVFFDLMADRTKPKFKESQIEIARLLHNFLASAITLVDHTRNIILDGQSTSEFVKAYDQQKQAFFVDNPLHSFVQNLRNYTIHYRLPLATFKMEGVRVKDTNKMNFSFSVDLEREILLKWTRWGATDQTYLENLKSDIVLQELAEEYFQLVYQFHLWIHNTLRQLHASELEWLDSMIELLDIKNIIDQNSP